MLLNALDVGAAARQCRWREYQLDDANEAGSRGMDTGDIAIKILCKTKDGAGNWEMPWHSGPPEAPPPLTQKPIKDTALSSYGRRDWNLDIAQPSGNLLPVAQA